MNFDALRDWFRGEDCMVLGCGPSVRFDSRVWTIGCNRSAVEHPVDIAACFEPPLWDPAIWEAINRTAPMLVLAHVMTKGRGPRALPVCPRAVVMPNKVPPTWWDIGGGMKHPGQAPWFAAAIAGWMGFERVGLVGVDLTPPRFGDEEVKRANEKYGELAEFLAARGTKLVNAGHPSISRLTCLPFSTEIRPKNWSMEPCKS